MKQIAKQVGFLMVVLALLASPVWGKSANQNVANTIHNLSTSSTYFFYQSDNVDEVCVFCHTPHGGLLNGPLWNHSLPAANSFTHYNTVVLSSLGYTTTRNVNDESLICMACHDGSVGVSHLINDPNSLGGADPTIVGDPDVEIMGLWGQTGGRIGASLADTFNETGNLSDDHPISFSYDDVVNDPVYTVGAKANELNPIGTTGDMNSVLGWKGEGVRLFGADYRVECSSCHDPHVDYVTDTDYTPFLIRPNSGSDLCLACHVK